MSLYSISVKSITFDEVTHIPSGYSYLKTYDYRLNKEHPPLTKIISALPLLFLNPVLPIDHPSWHESRKWSHPQWVFGRQFFYVRNKNTDQLVFWARIPMIFLGIILGVYVFLFARDLYGKTAGYFSLVLYSFSPNILAHARLVTPDIGLTCFSFISIYYLWKFIYKGKAEGFWLSGVFLGLSMASKFSAVYLIPIFVIIAGIQVYSEYRTLQPDVPFYKFEPFRSLFYKIALLFAIGLGILILTYGIENLYYFLKGFKFQILNVNKGHSAFLMGEYSTVGWPHYFLIAFLIKTPLALLLLIAITLVWYRKNNPEIRKALRRDLFLIIPVGIMFGVAMMSRQNIGLRYILPIYPFLFVFIGQTVFIKCKNLSKYAVLSGLTAWFVISSIAIAPHYLAYFNEIVGGPNNGYKYLLDSNIDWGQDLKLLSSYLKERNIKKIKISYFGKDTCEYRKIECEILDCTPQAGILAVSATNLFGVYSDQKDCLKWLHDFNPIKKIGYSIFIYDIKEKDILNSIKNTIKTN